MIYPNPQIYPHLKTIFVHVPKTAGTSIETRLRENNSVVVGGHTTAEGFRKKYPDVFNDYYKFAVVRHPAERFASAFYYLLKHPIHEALNNEIVHQFATLDKFARHVEANPGIIRRIVHLLPQHEFICDAQDRILVDNLCRFENLPEDWLRTCHAIGLPPVPLEKLNSSFRDETRKYDKHGIGELAKALYRKDFDLFGFDSEFGQDLRT